MKIRQIQYKYRNGMEIGRIGKLGIIIVLVIKWPLFNRWMKNWTIQNLKVGWFMICDQIHSSKEQTHVLYTCQLQLWTHQFTTSSLACLCQRERERERYLNWYLNVWGIGLGRKIMVVAYFSLTINWVPTTTSQLSSFSFQWKIEL